MADEQATSVSKELIYTHVMPDRTIREESVMRFFSDGTYRCDHWDERQYWLWKVEEGRVFWAVKDVYTDGALNITRSEPVPKSWSTWVSPAKKDDSQDLAHALEMELSFKKIIG